MQRLSGRQQARGVESSVFLQNAPSRPPATPEPRKACLPPHPGSPLSPQDEAGMRKKAGSSSAITDPQNQVRGLGDQVGGRCGPVRSTNTG